MLHLELVFCTSGSGKGHGTSVAFPLWSKPDLAGGPLGMEVMAVTLLSMINGNYSRILKEIKNKQWEEIYTTIKKTTGPHL